MKETRQQAVLMQSSGDVMSCLGGTPSLEQDQWLVLTFYKDRSEYLDWIRSSLAQKQKNRGQIKTVGRMAFKKIFRDINIFINFENRKIKF